MYFEADRQHQKYNSKEGFILWIDRISQSVLLQESLQFSLL